MIQWIFSCKHPRTGWPQTSRATGRTTIQCLTCGQRVPYNWGTMQRGPTTTTMAQSPSFKLFPWFAK